MPFVQEYWPQIRDTDLDGFVGLRGGLRCFQDVYTGFMYSLGKGNDVLPVRYGAVWVYTHCLIRMDKKLEYGAPAALSAWIEPGNQPARVLLGVTITQRGEIAARGRIDTCVFSLSERRPLRPRDIEFPDGLAEDVPNSIPPFSRLERGTEGMEKRYEKTVRFSDLDSSRHMNNLRYFEMF